MIRRDYLLRMIEQLVATLARSRTLVAQRELIAASGALDEQTQILTGKTIKEIEPLSDTDLTALLLGNEPELALRDKCMIMAAILEQSGDISDAEDDRSSASVAYLRALQLLLDNLDERQPVPEYAPTIERLRSKLVDAPLPVSMVLSLVRYFEGRGQFDKCEDLLFTLMEAEPDNAQLLVFMNLFYQRLLSKSDDALEVGNLPRTEIEAALGEIHSRQRAIGFQ